MSQNPESGRFAALPVLCPDCHWPTNRTWPESCETCGRRLPRPFAGANSSVSVEEALRPFGWTCGPEFQRRYATDEWVFNLANAVQVLTAINRDLRAQIDGSGVGDE